MSRGVIVAVLLLLATPALSQTPREAPQAGFRLHDERSAGPFVVQRWVSSSRPEVSSAGVCDCLVVVYEGARQVMTFGTPGTLAAYDLTALTGHDINGDGLPDLVVSAWSGGAHCCYSSGVYSVGEDVRVVLSVETGNCGPGEFTDLDGDGTREYITCDDQWAYAYCSFADSPLPRVVYSYDTNRGAYVLNTPRYANHFRDELGKALDQAQAWVAASAGRDPELGKCRLLKPALGLMYSGRLSDGVALIRGLYRGADREDFERDTVERVRKSPLWVER